MSESVGLLTSEKVKAIQFAGDGGSIISRIIALESKTKIEVEYLNDDAIINKGVTMVLECDKKEKWR